MILFILICLALVIGYFCWPEKQYALPENAIELDLSKTENSDFFLSEECYGDNMEAMVEPYLEERKQEGYFNGYDGNPLYFEQYKADDEIAHIVMVHGYTDAAYKFKEVAYYFLKSGYSVSIYEHRGHGYSYRAIDDPSRVTVTSFQEYVDDLKIFVEEIVRPTLSDKEQLFVYAHSMGGGVTALALEQNPNLFEAAVLTSPMMEVEFDGIPNHMAEALVSVMKLTGNGEQYVLGGEPYNGYYEGTNGSMNSPARYDYLYHVQASDVNYQTNAGTYDWLGAAIEATERIREHASDFTTDALLFQASDDTIVGPNGQNEFASKASNVQLITVANTKHSILFSGNNVFIPYMNTILDFYEAAIMTN